MKCGSRSPDTASIARNCTLCEPLETVVRQTSAYYGTLIRRAYGEPFFTTEMMLVDDVVSLEVATF